MDANADLVIAAGLPAAATDSVSAWDELLTRGRLASDPEGFSVGRLGEEEYRALAQLALNYFAAKYEFFTPAALRPVDRDALRARFGPA